MKSLDESFDVGSRQSMERVLKPDEHYMDGEDTWLVHYITSVGSRESDGDYTENIQVFRNGELVGQTLWCKDKDGNNKTKAYEEGFHTIPVTAKEVTTRN